jgi:hypothetical protein
MNSTIWSSLITILPRSFFPMINPYQEASVRTSAPSLPE